MTPVEALLGELSARGVHLRCDGDTIRLSPKAAVSKRLLEHVRSQKAALLAHYGSRRWPAECLDAERRFGQRHMRLGPLLGQTVETPRGRGRLIQVIAPRATVVLDQSPETATDFFWEEILPGENRLSRLDRLPGSVEEEPAHLPQSGAT